jgi:hypothetical protein
MNQKGIATHRSSASRLTALTVSVGLTMVTSLTVQADEAQTARLVAPAASAVPAPTVPSGGASSTIVDVKLDAAGVLRGRVVNGSGVAADGASVAIRRGETVVAQGTTDQRGEFAAPGMSLGVYTLETATSRRVCRVWTGDTAPPSAQSVALLVTGEPVVRGQIGYANPADWITIGLGAAGVALGVIAIDKIDDLDADVNTMRNNLVPNPVSP